MSDGACCISTTWLISATSSSDDKEIYERLITSAGFGMTVAYEQRQRVKFPLGRGSSSLSLKSAPKIVMYKEGGVQL